MVARLLVLAGIVANGTYAAGQDRAPAENPGSVPGSLEALIPQSALDNPEDWAAKGAGDLPHSEPEPEFSPRPLREPEGEPTAPVPDAAISQPLPFNIDAALAADDVSEPEPLSQDPDKPSFADINAPTLVDLPDLVEVKLSDQLTLAFPAEEGLFPEEERFIARFRALSAIETLATGDTTVPQLAARARSDEALLADVLRNYGYYDGEVIRQLSGGLRGFADEDGRGGDGEAERVPNVRFDVLPGERYRVGVIDLGRFDDLSEEDRKRLLKAFGIAPGNPLFADDIVAGLGSLRLAMGENGYPFAELSEPELLIDHTRQEGDLSVNVDPGGKYMFGAVTSSDPGFLSGRHLERIARFGPGDLYQTSLQADLRRAILATGLVSSVVITPREVTPPDEGQPGEVTLDVDVERAPLRTISGAIGYGTEDGLKVEAAWEHRNLFPPEGALRLRGILGTREQLASVTFRRSNFRARDQVLTLDTFASAIETEAVDARTIAFRGSIERVSNLLFQKPLSWQLGAEVLYTDERNRLTNGITRPRQEYLIGGVFGRATIDASDDLLDPRKGYRVTFFAEPEVSRTLGRASPYLRARVDASYYQPVGRTVIAARVATASVAGADLLDIAPSRRLYSGGGGSVRGYGFQAIGPRNAFDEPQGGRSLLEAAVEARIPTNFFNGALEVVPFFDLGSISSDPVPTFDVLRAGAGIGVRYKTTFGPIRVDLGVPLNPAASDAPFVVYVSLGQAF